jgi:hypothetical protein
LWRAWHWASCATGQQRGCRGDEKEFEFHKFYLILTGKTATLPF